MKKIMLAALMTLAMGGANAEVYVGGTLGAAKLSLDCPVGVSCDGTDSAGKFYVGYSEASHSNLAFEAGYLNAGKAKASSGNLSGQAKSDALFVVGVLHGNFTPEFGGGGRLGFAWTRMKCNNFPVLGSKVSNSEVDLTPIFGGQLDYAFSKNWKGVTAIDITKGECNDASGSIRLLTVGAQYSF